MSEEFRITPIAKHTGTGSPRSLGTHLLFIPFLVVHLLADLAMPSLPGAFRFNPAESVHGVRAMVVVSDALTRPAEAQGLKASSRSLPGVARALPAELPWNSPAPYLAVSLPRRDTASEPSPQPPSEDH